MMCPFPQFVKCLDEFESTLEMQKSMSGTWTRLDNGLNATELVLRFKNFIEEKMKSKKHFNIQDICD